MADDAKAIISFPEFKMHFDGLSQELDTSSTKGMTTLINAKLFEKHATKLTIILKDGSFYAARVSCIYVRVVEGKVNSFSKHKLPYFKTQLQISDYIALYHIYSKQLNWYAILIF